MREAPISTKFYDFPVVENRNTLSNQRLKRGKGEFFPFFCQETPRPPYGAQSPPPFSIFRNMPCGSAPHSWRLVLERHRKAHGIVAYVRAMPTFRWPWLALGIPLCPLWALWLGEGVRKGVVERVSLSESSETVSRRGIGACPWAASPSALLVWATRQQTGACVDGLDLDTCHCQQSAQES